MRAKVKSLISVRKDETDNIFTDIVSFSSSGHYHLQKALENTIWNMGQNIGYQLPDYQEKQFEIELEVKTPEED